jgi:hypothetical protein
MSAPDAPAPGAAEPAERRRSPLLRPMAAVAAVLLVVTLGVGAVILSDRDPGADAPALPDLADIRDAGRAAVPVCGFPTLDRISDDGVDAEVRQSVLRTVVPDVQTLEGSRIQSFRVRDGVAYVMEFDGRASYVVTGYDLATGGTRTSVTVPLAWEPGSESFSTDHFEVDEDGSIYLLDTLEGRRDLIKVRHDGDLAWRTALPRGPQTRGSVIDLYGLARWSGLRDEPVIGVHEGDRFHLVTTDGEYDGLIGSFPGHLLGQLPDGAVATLDEREARGRSVASLLVTDGDGTVRTRLTASRDLETAFGASTQHWPSGAAGVAPGPGGEGYLVVRDLTGIEWLADDGVRKGIWLDSQLNPDNVVAVYDGSPLLLADGAYYFLSRGQQGLGLTAVPEEGMAYLLEASVRYNAASDPMLAQLGAGAGLVTDMAYNHFPDGVPPAVRASFDESWADSGYRLRYEIRGDPTVYDPVATEPAVVDVRGGDIELALPPTRPGVYEVDAALLDGASGDAVAGTCLRYTVAAPGGPGPMSELAPGADWGGAQPLRGVQIAEEFAIGSHRWQLDFGAIVPDPAASPSVDALRWDSLPRAGADEATAGDPFTQLAQAAQLAQETGTALVLQLGSGGEAERAAVEAGTWEGWVEAIVREVHRRAPEIVYWQPWNEPNNAGFAGDDYVEQIGRPFARAARAADPDVTIIGGNVLGTEPHWWRAAVDAGACDSMDIAGFHPYTGLNRTWEEEGFHRADSAIDQVVDAVAECDIPVWDTESGWWSDGVANFWAQGASVARKLLWYRVQGVAEWTYFFSEGGFGENSTSWSLIQFGRYVKPGAAAFAGTARLLEGREAEVLDTAIPYVHAMRLGPTGSTEGVADPEAELLAVWTDDLTTDVVLTAPGGEASVELIDQYGAVRALDLPAGGAPVRVTGAPLVIAAAAGTGVEVAAVESFGPDVLAGARARASSTHPDASIANVTSGTANVQDPWRSGSLADGAMDEAPWVQVDLPRATEINRVAVSTPGIRCCTSGLRNYTVSVRDEAGAWTQVAEQRDQFFDRVALVTFPPVTATAVRVDVPMTVERGVPVLSANYTGVVGGAHPFFMPLESTSEWIAAVSSIAAWAPGG